MTDKKKSPNHILCILSGIITAIGFKSPDYNFLIWFSLIPCFYVLFSPNIRYIKQSFCVMFYFALTFYIVLFSFLWGLYPLDWRGFTNNQSIILILVAWIGLSLFEALFVALMGVLWFLLNKVIRIKWLTITLLWIIMEWSQGLGSVGFTWGRLANSQYNNSYIIQSVSIFGSLFLSAIIVLANSFIAVHLHNKNNYKYIIAFFCIFIINFGYGYYRINNIQHSDKTIQASVIQANINTAEKWDSDNLYNILDIYTQLTKIADNNSEKKLDIVVWAETSIPVNLSEESEFLNTCHEIANFIGSTILVGGFENIENNSYNAIFAISPSDKNKQSYHKQNLVPFGEYLPLRNILEKFIPSLENIAASSQDINFGKKKDVITTSNAIVANLICFDSIFPEVARQQVIDGANIIAVETNDSWFNGTAAIQQHLSQSVIRAVENNRYVLRSANTGISAIISPIGKIVSALQAETSGYINYEVELIDDKTLYTELGDIIVFLSMFLLILIGFISSLAEYIIMPVVEKIKFFWNMIKR